eukprot:scaffold707_cov399-Prasinococcus_capsulatus_cf.AAC.20
MSGTDIVDVDMSEDGSSGEDAAPATRVSALLAARLDVLGAIVAVSDMSDEAGRDDFAGERKTLNEQTVVAERRVSDDDLCFADFKADVSPWNVCAALGWAVQAWYIAQRRCLVFVVRGAALDTL